MTALIQPSSSQITEPLRLALLGFAKSVMETRKPDFTAGDQYLERWHLGPYGSSANAYIHRFSGDDVDGVLHDHPYDNVSVILSVGYIEHSHAKPLTIGRHGKYLTTWIRRSPGEVIERKATVAHRLALIDGQPAISLFLPGPRYREWGFHCPEGWKHYKEFLTPNGGRIGCEHSL